MATLRPSSWLAPLWRAGRPMIGALMVTALSLAGSGIGFVFQVVLAARFGAGETVDAYLFAISLPTFIGGLGGAALSYMIVPALVAVEGDPERRAALLRRLRGRIAMVAVVGAVIGLPAALLQPLLLPIGAPLRGLAVLPTMIMLGWAIGATQFFAALFPIELNAARRPIIAATLALPPNLGAILIVLVAPHAIVAAPVGALIGSAAALLIGTSLTRAAFARSGGAAPSDARLDIRPTQIVWTLLAMSCFSAYAIIDAFWAPRTASGTLASLGYAQRLTIGLGGLVVAGPSAILTPRLAALLRDDGGGAFLQGAMRIVALVGVIGGLGAIAMALLAHPLIALAFARGAFGSDEIDRVAAVFRAMMPGFFAMLMSVVLTRAIFCLPNIERAMGALALGWSTIYFAVAGLLRGWGGTGFGIAYSIAWSVYLLVAVWLLRRYARAVP